MPLYLPDQALKWIIRKIIKVNTKSLDKEEAKYRRSEREIAVEEYWKTVTVYKKNKYTEVEMVAGGPSSAKVKSESMGVAKLGHELVDAYMDVELDDSDYGDTVI